jgi:uncharacterized protein (TIGR00730 family)
MKPQDDSPAAADQPRPAAPTNGVVSLSGREFEAADTLLRGAVLKLWDAVDDLTRLRPARSYTYEATIFGSARIAPGSADYEGARRLAEELARLGATVVTGGGPGMMQAANEGAMAGAPDHPERSIGIRIDLEFEQSANAFVGRVYEHKTFFSRLHHFMVRSNIFVVTPGGIGTLLELAMAWQLLQVRKLYDTPLILVGPMWAELVEWATKSMIDSGMASPIDMSIPKCVDTVEQAMELIRPHYQAWLDQGTSGVDCLGKSG